MMKTVGVGCGQIRNGTRGGTHKTKLKKEVQPDDSYRMHKGGEARRKN